MPNRASVLLMDDTTTSERTVTRCLKVQACFPGYRSKDLYGKVKKKPDTDASPSAKDESSPDAPPPAKRVRDPDAAPHLMRQLKQAQLDLTVAANRLATALYAVESGVLPQPLGPDGRPIALRTLAYQGMSGQWQPYGKPLYTPVRRCASALTQPVANRVAKRIGKDLNEVMRGEKSLPSFRSTPLSFNGQKVYLDTSSGTFSLSLWCAEAPREPKAAKASRADQALTGGKAKSKGAQEPKGGPKKSKKARLDERATRITVAPCKMGSGEKAIWKRILSGEYSVGEVSLIYDDRKRRWMLAIPWTGKIAAKPMGLICGIDLGIATAVTCSYIEQDGTALYDRDYFRIPESVQRGWDAVQSDRRERAHFRRECYGLNEGRGVDRKLRSTEHLSERRANLVDSAIKQVAAACVKVLCERGVSHLVLENLKGITDRKFDETEAMQGRERRQARKNFIRFNSAGLANALFLAATKAGIMTSDRTISKPTAGDFVPVSAAYTSLTCHECGKVYESTKLSKRFIGREEKCYGRLTQSLFKCECGFSGNADWNAGINIARRGLAMLKSIEQYRLTKIASKVVKVTSASAPA